MVLNAIKHNYDTFTSFVSRIRDLIIRWDLHAYKSRMKR